MGSTAITSPVPVAARRAVTLIFFVNGAVFANWVPRIPEVKQELGLGESTLGLALLGVALGAVLALPAGGYLAARFGSRPTVQLSLGIFGGALILVGLAFNLPSLAAALFLLGAANSVLDVAMNAQGVAVDRRYPRPVFTSFHAAFSFGFVGGAATGSLAAASGLDPFLHFAAAGTTFAAAGLTASAWLLPAHADAVREQPVVVRPSRGLAGLGLVAICAALAEGAAADWSTLYLRESLGVGAALGGTAFAAFSLMMGVGRLLGDRLNVAWGPVSLARRGAGLAAASLAAALIASHPWVAVLGFAGLGAGVSIVFPLALSAAGRAPGMATASAIAAVSTAGYLGFVAGPPLIGFVAEAVALPAALWIVVAACVGIALLSRAVRTARADVASRTAHPVETAVG
jgi:MFS family permease